MAHYQHSDAIDPTETNPEYRVTPPGAGHEHTDANVWLIAKFGLWLLDLRDRDPRRHGRHVRHVRRDA